MCLARFSQAGALSHTWQVRHCMQLEEDMRDERRDAFSLFGG